MLNVFEDIQYIGKLFSIWGIRKRRINIESPNKRKEKVRHIGVLIDESDYNHMDKIKEITGASHTAQARIAIRLLIESFEEHGFI
jgi:hypothetical protein